MRRGNFHKLISISSRNFSLSLAAGENQLSSIPDEIQNLASVETLRLGKHWDDVTLTAYAPLGDGVKHVVQFDTRNSQGLYRNGSFRRKPSLFDSYRGWGHDKLATSVFG